MKNLSAIAYGGKEIVFEVVNTDRKTMEIAVLPDCGVVVKVSQGDEASVKITRGFIFTTCCGVPNPDKVKLLLNTWYLVVPGRRKGNHNLV